MSELAVAEMRLRMLKDTEGFLARRLALSTATSAGRKEFIEQVRRSALRSETLSQEFLQELTL